MATAFPSLTPAAGAAAPNSRLAICVSISPNALTAEDSPLRSARRFFKARRVLDTPRLHAREFHTLKLANRFWTHLRQRRLAKNRGSLARLLREGLRLQVQDFSQRLPVPPGRDISNPFSRSMTQRDYAVGFDPFKTFSRTVGPVDQHGPNVRLIAQSKMRADIIGAEIAGICMDAAP
jgi:hypothetical protein